MEILSVIFLFTVNSSAQVGLNKVAQSTMNFLLVSVSPEASAMGDAYSAVGKGAASIFFNAAGIVETTRPFDVKIYITNIDLATWSAGIGIYSEIGNNEIEFNYSYSNFDIFSGVNRFSLGFLF